MKGAATMFNVIEETLFLNQFLDSLEKIPTDEELGRFCHYCRNMGVLLMDGGPNDAVHQILALEYFYAAQSGYRALCRSCPRMESYKKELKFVENRIHDAKNKKLR